MKMSPLVVALDFPDSEQAKKMVDQLDPNTVRLKIGKELFTRCGPSIVEHFTSQGFDVFLDLKFHDIPNTVAAAVRAAADLGVWMVNVHASGGRKMMEQAAEAVAGLKKRPLITAVTVLTSMDKQSLLETGVSDSLDDHVMRLSRLAFESGMDGVVCSAREAPELRKAYPGSFCLVTPGIRPAGAELGDQVRVVTPRQALQKGVDFMVIGRPITQAASPASAVGEIIQSLK